MRNQEIVRDYNVYTTVFAVFDYTLMPVDWESLSGSWMLDQIYMPTERGLASSRGEATREGEKDFSNFVYYFRLVLVAQLVLL